MNTSYGSGRYNATVGSMIVEIINWIINGLIGLILLSTATYLTNDDAFYNNMLSAFSDDILSQFIEICGSLGYTLREGLIYAAYVIAIYFLVIGVMAFIAMIISIRSIIKAKKGIVSFALPSIVALIISIVALCLKPISDEVTPEV